MNNTITLNKTKTIVQLELDDCSFNPREADKVTTIYAEHKRYNFSEVETYNNCESWNEVYKNIVTEYNPVLIYPLYMLDHSCIRLSISNFNDRWDSGQVGFIFITRKDMQKYYGFKNLTSKRKELLKNALNAELKTYNQYINGEVYCLTVYNRFEDTCGHIVDDYEDSLGGLYLETSEDVPKYIKEYFNLNPDEYELKEIA